MGVGYQNLKHCLYATLYMIIWNASNGNSFHIAEFVESDFAMEIKCDVRLMEFGLIL